LYGPFGAVARQGCDEQPLFTGAVACPFDTKKMRAEKAAWTRPRLRNLDMTTEDQP
jgi:hypothetical protein